MTLDDTLREADEALKKLQERMRKTLELKEQEAARHQEKAPPTETSAEKLRKILKEEKRMKRKRRHSTSSSSSTTSDSTSSPAKSVKKSRKRKHKKKHKRRRASSDSKDEMFLAPANTSASFLQQRQTITKLLHDDDDDDDDDDDEEEQWCEKVARGRSEDTPFKPRLDDLDRNGDGAEQRWEGPKPRRDSSSSVQSEASHTSHKQRFSGPGESRPGRSERPDGGEERAGRGSDTSVVTDLRKANLIDIFSQIAEFQKAKKQKT